MKISEIEIQNVKGRSGKWTLGGVNLIIGSNATGKSTLPTAIRLGLSGWLPLPIGHAAGSIYKLAGNPDESGEMAINLTMDTGRTVRQKWLRDAKGKCSTEGGVAADLAMPELLMEPRQFFAKTGAERIKTIFEACDIAASGYGPELIQARLLSVDAMPAAVCQSTLDTVETMILAEFRDDVSLQRATENLIVKLKDAWKASKDAAARASGAFQAFRTNVQGDRPKDQGGALAARRTALLNLKAKQIGADTVLIQNNLDRVQGQIAAILQQFGTPLMPVDDFPVKLTQFQNDLVELLSIKLTQLKNDLGALKVVEPYDGTEDLEVLNGDYASKCLESDENLMAINSAQAELAAIHKFELCEKCTKKVKTPTKNKIKMLRSVSDQLDRTRTSILESLGRVEAKAKAWNDYRDKRDSLTANINGTKATLDQLTALLADKAAAQAMIDGATKPDSKLTADISACQTEVNVLQFADDVYQQYKRDLGRRDELEGELLTNQCKTEVYKSVLTIVVEEQAKVANFAFSEVLGLTRGFTDGLLNSPLEFRNGDLGRKVSDEDVEAGCVAPIGSWITQECFSGFELAMTLNAFGLALSKKAPLKLVIIDDCIISPDNKMRMVIRFTELMNHGVIHQAIIVDVSDADYALVKDLMTVVKV